MARISPGQMLSPPLSPRLPEPRAVRVRISPKLSLHQVLGGQPHLWEPKILGESLGPTCCSGPPPWSGVTQTPIQGRPGHPCTLCPGLSPFTGRCLPVCAGTRDGAVAPAWLRPSSRPKAGVRRLAEPGSTDQGGQTGPLGGQRSPPGTWWGHSRRRGHREQMSNVPKAEPRSLGGGRGKPTRWHFKTEHLPPPSPPPRLQQSRSPRAAWHLQSSRTHNSPSCTFRKQHVLCAPHRPPARPPDCPRASVPALQCARSPAKHPEPEGRPIWTALGAAHHLALGTG